MDWKRGWRSQVWNNLEQDWDLIIVGGGITGAGILHQAAAAGLKTLLVEANDFGSGTSSRSSKLVHGGLRYLGSAQIKLTFESVREREYLLAQGRGLVTPLGFLYACQQGDNLPGWAFGMGLCAYDLMARQWQHRSYDTLDMRELCPVLTTPDLKGGYRYFDAQTDDARLVLRLIRESVEMGGTALNYAAAVDLLRTRDGRVRGILLEDRSGQQADSVELKAQVVINAAGVWVDRLRRLIDREPRMRSLRGSHLILDRERLPLSRAVTFLHPQDGRPVFAIPWEGAILFGTTDLDHAGELVSDPAISAEEFDYLLSALQKVFPDQELEAGDVISTFSGLRPVVDTGKQDPSRESREYAVWEENCLITVAGGKLTTFRLMARDGLEKACRQLPSMRFNHKQPALNPTPDGDLLRELNDSYAPYQQLRLLGRYSAGMLADLAGLETAAHQLIPGTPYTWAELRLAARHEGVVHLDDLLLRRLRLGLLLPRGGLQLISRVAEITRSELGWTDGRWEQEITAYRELIRSSYSQAGQLSSQAIRALVRVPEKTLANRGRKEYG